MTENTRNLMRVLCVMFVAVLTGACATLSSLRPEGGPAEIEHIERSTTVRWGHPLAGKRPPRVLIAVPRTAARDAAEFEFRVDMVRDVVLLDGPTEQGAEASEVLEKALERRLDLIVLANIEFASLPEAVFGRIREQVHDGAGLLLAHHRRNMPEWFDGFLGELAAVEPVQPITRGIAEQLTPEWQGGLDFVQAGTYGAGRVVQLNYPGGSPAYHALLPALLHPEQAEWAHYETYWSLIAKAALWAAKRDPAQWIDRIQEEAREGGFEELPPGMTEAEMQEYIASTDTRVLRSYRVYLSAPANEPYTVTAQLRQPGRGWRTRFAPADDSFRAGDESFLLNVPAIPGEFYLDTWIKHRNRVIDWHSVPVTIAARPYFSELRAPRDVVRPNDTVSLAFELLPSQRTEEGLRQCVVALRATDAYGRRVAFEIEDAPGGRRPYTARFDVADLISNRITAECLMLSRPLRGGALKEFQLINVGGDRIPLGVRHPRSLHRFSLAIANPGRQEYTLRALNEMLAEAGVSTVITPAVEDAARFVPDAGLSPVFQLTQHWRPREIEVLAAEGEIPHGAPPPAVLEQLTEGVRRVRLGAAESFLLGGVHGFTDTYDVLRTSPSVMQEFRDRLWAEFGTPAGLGDQWAERFLGWEDLSRESIDRAAADGFIEPWVRFHQHVDAVLLRLYGMARDAVRTGEPFAPTGFSMAASGEGVNPLWHGSASAVEFVIIPSDRASMARAVAYKGGEAAAMLHAPGASSRAEARWWPWHAVLNGHAGIAWNLGKGPEGAFEGVRAIDPIFAEAAAQTKAVQAGFAELFLAAEPAGGAVAVYDSRASEFVRNARGGGDNPMSGALEMLSELGFAAQIIAPSASYPAALDGVSCLLLPGTDALSDAELAHIETFVQRGGVVLADTPPGAFDALGRPRESLPLSGMFHVLTPETRAENDEQDAEVIETPGPEHSAFLLGRAFSEDRSPEVLSMVENVLRGAGCPETLAIDPAGVFTGQRFHFRFGMADVYAALAPPDQSGRNKYRIAIPGGGYVYDMQRGMEVRRPKRITWRARAADVALFSALPYRVTEVQAVVPERVRPGNRLLIGLRILTEDRPPGRHLVHVQLRPVGGEPIPYYDKTVVCEDGRGETFIPLALDEAPGFYRVAVRDVLTGITSEWPVEIGTPGVGRVSVTISPPS